MTYNISFGADVDELYLGEIDYHENDTDNKLNKEKIIPQPLANSNLIYLFNMCNFYFNMCANLTCAKFNTGTQGI